MAAAYSFYNQLLLLLFLLCFTGGCSPAGQAQASGQKPLPQPTRSGQKAQAPAVDTVSFATQFGRFFQALRAGDTAALNGFIHPAHGFWLIEQPGAVPAYTHYSVVQHVKRQYRQQPFTSIAEQMQQCRLRQRQTFPVFDCADMHQGASGFAEDGCFYSTQTAAFQNSDMWQYANLNKQEQQQVQLLQQQVAATVLHTASSYRFHFGYRKGQWVLLFADLRVPCSA